MRVLIIPGIFIFCVLAMILWPQLQNFFDYRSHNDLD